ncbi:MAG: FKBP-type peptidyl-prolyl cis-trans isomerase [Solirubrobacteraceae bacterium]|jgi:peptidylprolyl isomerase
MRLILIPFATLATAATLAACGGSSNNADTAHIIAAPSQAQTLKPPQTKAITIPATTTPATTKTAAVPSSGPLSTEPKITVPSGAAPTKLVTKDIIVGTGAVAKAGDELTVDYVGALYKNASIFDASWSHGGPKGEPFQFELGNGSVISGWDQGLVGMRVGGRRELIIPPSLAYKNVAQSKIPANSTLIFIVDLLAVSKA